jgi:hypothetical protein
MAEMTKSMLVDIYDAWRAHDLDWLATYLPDDFSHSINIPSELYPLGGVRRGKREALERLHKVFQQFDTRHFEFNLAGVSGSCATVEIEAHCLHGPSGALLHTVKKNIWRLEDGWPVGLEEVYDLEGFKTFLNSVSYQPA